MNMVVMAIMAVLFMVAGVGVEKGNTAMIVVPIMFTGAMIMIMAIIAV